MEKIVKLLKKYLSEDQLSTDLELTSLYSQDILTVAKPVEVVVSPKNLQQIVHIVNIVREQGYRLISRGGGMSYTGGYLSSHRQCVLIDLKKMNRIVEINTTDSYITVEAGCTWQQLYNELQGTGYRTPYWGTLSGSHATVAGSMSNNSIFWGSSHYGFSVDSIVSMDIVLADGSILTTGSAGRRNTQPFIRHFGPDLTGLFSCDNGAFGIKATITLKLIPQLKKQAYLAYDFPDYTHLASAMSDISRAALASEILGFDSFLLSQRMKRESITKDIKALSNVMKNSENIGKSIKEGFKTAVAGRGYTKNVQWSLQVMLEGRSAACIDAMTEDILCITNRHHGTTIENSIPKVLRANPFPGVNSMVGPNGERWLPVHALVPHSKAIDVYQVTEKICNQYKDEMSDMKIQYGYFVTTVSTHCFVLEIVFFWQDAIQDLHKKMCDSQFIKNINHYPENVKARGNVIKIRDELIDAYKKLGSSHLQLGRTYPYVSSLNFSSQNIMKQLKTMLDPTGIMNPGVLGL